ncbi:MAG: helix-turn-helix domain-containing protein [Ktedonobacteraceae bacterium]|nr:helix-turn-helix domain-containing protein [Ktedonobacteraceae bacterium]
MKKPDKKQPYSSEETRKLLGISSSTLSNLVEKGLIEKIVAPGYTHGRYTRESVDQYYKEKKMFDEKYLSQDEEERSTTKVVKITTLEEMKECQDISQELFGVGEGTEKERMKIVERNPDTYYLLKKDNRGIGYVSIMPLKKGNLDNVLSQTLPVKIEESQIESFKKGKQLDIYLTAIGVRPEFSAEEKHEYGSMLVRKLIKLILELGKKGVVVGKIAARSNTPDGIRLMKHAGFTEIPPATPERRTFVINIKESGIPFILQYKKYLEESKNDAN